MIQVDKVFNKLWYNDTTWYSSYKSTEQPDALFMKYLANVQPQGHVFTIVYYLLTAIISHTQTSVLIFAPIYGNPEMTGLA